MHIPRERVMFEKGMRNGGTGFSYSTSIGGDRLRLGKIVLGFKIVLGKIAFGKIVLGFKIVLGKIVLGKMVLGKIALGKIALGKMVLGLTKSKTIANAG